MEIIWHYTTGQRLSGIAHSGVLRPSAPTRERSEKPVVWFSSKPDWDATANLIVATSGRARRYASKDETIIVGGGLARIGVAASIAPHDWKDYKKLSGVSPRRAKAMYDRAVAVGSRPNGWRVSFDPVPQSEWRIVEIWNDFEWLADSSYLRSETGESETGE